MTLVDPLDRSRLDDLAPLFDIVEAGMGFVPNSMLTMAHRPDMLQAFATLAGTVLAPGEVGNDLKRLVAEVASNAAGCQYCVAHTSHQAHRSGIADEKLEAVWSFEASDLFSDAEKSALTLAMKSAQVPNMVDSADMSALKEHFSDGEIVEIVGVISLFGFLNRWNATMATTLEDEPLSFATESLADTGWTAGRHKRT